MSEAELDTLVEKMKRCFEENVPSGNYGIICSVFDNGEDGLGTGFNINADVGDAMVTLVRIKEEFHIDAIRVIIQEGERDRYSPN